MPAPKLVQPRRADTAALKPLPNSRRASPSTNQLDEPPPPSVSLIRPPSRLRCSSSRDMPSDSQVLPKLLSNEARRQAIGQVELVGAAVARDFAILGRQRQPDVAPEARGAARCSIRAWRRSRARRWCRARPGTRPPPAPDRLALERLGALRRSRRRAASCGRAGQSHCPRPAATGAHRRGRSQAAPGRRTRACSRCGHGQRQSDRARPSRRWCGCGPSAPVRAGGAVRRLRATATRSSAKARE